MSTVDLRESSARVDRSGPSEGPVPHPRPLVARRSLVAALLLLPLVMALPAWLSQDRGEVVAMLRSQGVSADAFPSIPLDINESVEHWLEQFRTIRRAEFEALLERRGVFEGLIRGKLREHGMPEELLYLAMIESGLSPIAESHVEAVGLWQFMGPTALDLGLRVDEYVDERRDPVRATDAATTKPARACPSVFFSVATRCSPSPPPRRCRTDWTNFSSPVISAKNPSNS